MFIGTHIPGFGLGFIHHVEIDICIDHDRNDYGDFLFIQQLVYNNMPSLSFAPETRVTCSSSSFQCPFSSECIPYSGVCNGVEECEDGMDESSCHASEYFND